MELSPTDRRRLGRGALAAGLLGLVLPELLIDVARFVYDAALDVSFLPRDRTARRVRLLGVTLAIAGVALTVSAD